jgi:hypothetical protein
MIRSVVQRRESAFSTSSGISAGQTSSYLRCYLRSSFSFRLLILFLSRHFCTTLVVCVSKQLALPVFYLPNPATLNPLPLLCSDLNFDSLHTTIGHSMKHLLMSPRTTRAAATHAALDTTTSSANPGTIPTGGPPPSRKRKAPVRRDRARDEPEPSTATTTISPPRRAKRQRTAVPSHLAAGSAVTAPASTSGPGSRRGLRHRPAMSQPGYVDDTNSPSPRQSRHQWSWLRF